LDTLRADRLGCYGYSQAETPNLDRLASEGTRFEEAISPVPSTLPSHATILTGLFPQGHGVRDNGTFLLSEENVTLTELLQDAGYETAAFVSSFVIDSRFGLAQGFETYFDFDEDATASRRGMRDLSHVQRVGGETAERALKWLSRPRENPFFLWVHLYDPHAPFEAPEPYRSRFAERPYDGEIAYTDAVVGEILDRLEALGAAENTLVMVVGDHGESLGEHGEAYHSWFIYDATLKVPFLVRLPGVLPQGTVIEEQVRLADLAPTALDLLGIPEERWQDMQGTSLASWLTEGKREHLPAYSESLVAHLQFGWGELKAIRERGFKYIEAPRPELYDLGVDPGETRNLVAEKENVARQLKSRLDKLEQELRRQDGEPEPVNIDAEAMRKLQSLGYVAAPQQTGSSSDLAAVDPKDHIEDYRELIAAMEVIDSLEPEKAVAILAPLARKLPTHRLVHYRLGQAYLNKGDHRLAIGELELALALAPKAREDSGEPYIASNHYFLGVSHKRAGDLEEAIRYFEEAIGMSDHALSHWQLGELMLERGRKAEGLDHLRRARAASDDAEDLQTVGVSLAQHGELEDAVEAFTEASRLDLSSSSLEADWCAALLQLGLVQDSLSHCEKAVRFDDSSARAHLHLGIALEMADRVADARRHYERAVELDPQSRARERLSK
jgi:arylsulfatase A-like enzyme/Flp pilus assembly protein TadD